MRTVIMLPRVLMLDFPLVFISRTDSKFSSLEAILLQERQFLKNVVAQIVKFAPDIVMVHKTVSRLAQDFLLAAGITLILNVKRSVMDYVARCTKATCLTSVEMLNIRPRLGTCEQFGVHQVRCIIISCFELH